MNSGPGLTNGTHTSIDALEPPTPHADLPLRIRRLGSYCVLSLDGGGYRGYASLLMLRRILRPLVDSPTKRIYPYQYFDLICGTSTGGLIAILLGVLHLDIDEAIKIYKDLAKTLFAGRWRWLRWLFRDERFSSRVLRSTMQEVLRKHGCEEMLMNDRNRDKGCKCFVTTATKPRGSFPIRLIRSYPDPTRTGNQHPWSILDAALATSAAPTYFRAHVVTHDRAIYRYEDAGVHGLNNPTIVAWDECELVFPCTDEVSERAHIILSLGTGLKRHDPLENYIPPSNWVLETLGNAFGVIGRIKALSKHLSHEATKVDDRHGEMLRLTRKMKPSPYFRFSPDTDALGNISLSDSDATVRMENAVFSYSSSHQAELDLCVNWLKAGCDLSENPFCDPSLLPVGENIPTGLTSAVITPDASISQGSSRQPT
ncbi:hypothetical protein M408DRAFT_215580 [Serendipita vermifera MAFF 305830]|uniref:PNPLA domain-containing protein n=1 Tax=Serendipita vermifera MAFF 305830 TaxID=933852 RepID=A0A0C3B5W6_SERVB|nr:hypothetical protein M408DRAFT_215580 [Serendipita vermifera MAFF 305830]